MLNINELANALKPVVLPGEFMKVFILKEGKEYNQGVAYLDDGTMVVVDNARRMISRNIDVVVTSVLQTTAGKMIFGRYIESAARAVASQPGAGRAAAQRRPRAAHSAGAGQVISPDSPSLPQRSLRIPPYHWWRTVFFLIPAVALYTIVLGTASLVSTLFDRGGDFGHRCARAWAWLILKTTGVRVAVSGLEHLDPSRSYVCRREPSEHLRHSDRVRVAAAAAADRREGVARPHSRFSAGTCSGPGTCWSIARTRAPES